MVVVLDSAAAVSGAVVVEAAAPLLELARDGMWEGESNPTFSCFFRSLANLAIWRERRVVKVMNIVFYISNLSLAISL